MTPDRDLVTKWLIDLLEADANEYPVGDHASPGVVSYPYSVVWSIPGGYIDGPVLGASAADAGFVYQVDAVGRTRQQAEKFASRIRERVIGRGVDGAFSAAAADPAGLTVVARMADGSPGAPIAEGTRPDEVYTVSDRYVIAVSSS